jgi:hypothetical protein
MHMLDHDEIRAFRRFLNTASRSELADKRSSIDRMLGLVTQGTEEARDLRFMLRLLREELGARAEVDAIVARRLNR